MVGTAYSVFERIRNRPALSRFVQYRKVCDTMRIATKRYWCVPHLNLLREGREMAAGAETGSARPIKIKFRSKIKIETDKIQTRYCVKVVSG